MESRKSGAGRGRSRAKKASFSRRIQRFVNLGRAESKARERGMGSERLGDLGRAGGRSKMYRHIQSRAEGPSVHPAKGEALVNESDSIWRVVHRPTGLKVHLFMRRTIGPLGRTGARVLGGIFLYQGVALRWVNGCPIRGGISRVPLGDGLRLSS
jgi:hypothetical protein